MMVGYDVVFHQCEYGQSIPGLEGLVKKPTQVRTTKWSMKTGLRRICSGDHEHTRLGSSRASGTESYSEELAAKLAELMMADPSVEDEAAFPRYFEEAYRAEDVTTSCTAPAAAASGSASAEVRGLTGSVDRSVRLLWPRRRRRAVINAALALQSRTPTSFGLSTTPRRSRLPQ